MDQLTNGLLCSEFQKELGSEKLSGNTGKLFQMILNLKQRRYALI